jgi:hypothetical protein
MRNTLQCHIHVIFNDPVSIVGLSFLESQLKFCYNIVALPGNTRRPLPVNDSVNLCSRSNERVVCMTTRKTNCSTKCPLDGTRRPTLKGLLEDYRQWRVKVASARRQYSTKWRIRLPGGSTVRSEGFVCQEWGVKDSSARRQYRTEWRIRLLAVRCEGFVCQEAVQNGVKDSSARCEVWRIRLPGGSTARSDGFVYYMWGVKDSSARCEVWRIRLLGVRCEGFVCQEAVQDGLRIRLRDRTERVQSKEWLKKIDTAGRENTAGDGITKKIQEPEYKTEKTVFSLRGVRLCNK